MKRFTLIDDSRYDDVYMGGCVDSLGHINVLMNSLKKSRPAQDNERQQ